MLYENVKKVLIKNKKEIQKLGGRKLAIFGSVARNQAGKKSDVDILVDFDSKMGLFVFVDLKKYLEKILDSHVDLVTKNALHPCLKRKILDEVKNVF